ncbi:glycine betaine ABC transporter substrate-binding protein [Tepidanaerobacter syntrophicus]|uniref:ABC transporter permease/substrate-binding protein n=1 Tax=Tepidanaerobacter syntrophicus TaxID=224999 RepID=UPI001BD34EDD|nr:glycine betaine ABC transporter substrate-binding protein [Tepidanaerobacter syntrophicus]
MSGYFQYMINNSQEIFFYLLQHVQMTCIAVVMSVVIGVPLGILVSYYIKLSKLVIGFVNVVQAIPSVAMLGFAIPFLGIGIKPAIVMVILYSLLPIVKNTFIGIQNISPEIIEVAEGIGLTKKQTLQKVQIPLALPVIMSGVRISAVTAVGLMTIAAFVGAGGLGYLVFSGIRTVNNYQVLAGAVPACFLALCVDWLVGLVEKLVTPASLKRSRSKNEINKKHNKRQIRGIIIFTCCCIIILLISSLAGLNAGKSNLSIRVGAKDFTEQFIIGNMIADIIEDRTNLTVSRNFNMGGTQAVFNAIISDNLDIYVEYTGTAYVEILKYPPSSNHELVYQTVKKDFKDKYNIDVLNQWKFNDTYTLAVRRETAEKYNLVTISDLAKVSEHLIAGTTLEFLNRDDCMPGLKKMYNLHFAKEVGIDGSPRYIALVNHETDVVDAFSTDGLLKKFDLVVLKDDKNYFPPYYAIPLVRNETLKANPQLEAILDELGDKLTNEVMMDLNYQVDVEHKRPEDVARSFLLERNLIQK